VNFSVFSRNGTAVSLLLFREAEDGTPMAEITLDPRKNRTGDLWHVYIHGLAPGTLYLYKVDGPYLPELGHRFNAHKALIDPYAKALSGDFIWNTRHALGYDPASPDGDISFNTENDAAYTPKGIVIDDGEFDWRGDKPLDYHLKNTIIYETHVRGLTMNSNSGVGHPGTYRGVIEKIPYFKELGVTSLEFLPLHEFDELGNAHRNPRTGQRLHDYWGYSTIAFFAPKSSYSSSGGRGEQVTEFKEMVRELHAAGLEIILDIVFNHTAEGDETGPTLSFRGLDNAIYYLLDPEEPRRYRNFSGCGNTLNCNHPVVRSFILDCLRYWVIDMHVDGFRFDLGSILGRDRMGRLMENPPILERIAEDPVLRNTKIIAEAWDAGGAYQVGSFPGGRWAEWNDRFRDDVRRFWRGDEGAIRGLATRLTGSSDLYKDDGRKPFHSVNYVTCHDGFTLNDLVSYNGKHNMENGEKNRDGNDSNFSYNNGFEGPAPNPAIEAVRARQVRNFLATLMLSTGTPMILGGDEFRRTQRGNNNAYCQNNELSWYDWALIEERADVSRFLRELIALRKGNAAFLRSEFFSGSNEAGQGDEGIFWYDEGGKEPDWGRQEGFLAYRIGGGREFLMILNARPEAVPFSLPAGAKPWKRLIDTGLPSPGDIVPGGAEETPGGGTILSGPRTFMLFMREKE
jgi:isoamylase